MMQQGFQDDVDPIAKRLSIETRCSIMFAEGKNLLVCKHGVLFSMSRLKDQNDWSLAITKHSEEVKT